jgi:hypothetical protein
MSNGFEIPSHDALIAEQAAVQVEKFQGRQLDEYSSLIFPGQSWREPRGSAVVDFVRPIIGNAERATLQGLLEGMSKVNEDQIINWVDMGGGRAIPMRQISSMPDIGAKVKMTNVDLFDFGLDGLKANELEYLEKQTPGMTSESASPTLIIDDVERVVLPEKADLITSIEAVQYLNNPLAAIANWYNQLTDNGLLFVATERDWSSWITYDKFPEGSVWPDSPTSDFLDELSENDIKFAICDEADWPGGRRPEERRDKFGILVIQKTRDTTIEVKQPVAEVWSNLWDFKTISYKP